MEELIRQALVASPVQGSAINMRSRTLGEALYPDALEAAVNAVLEAIDYAKGLT